MVRATCLNIDLLLWCVVQRNKVKDIFTHVDSQVIEKRVCARKTQELGLTFQTANNRLDSVPTRGCDSEKTKKGRKKTEVGGRDIRHRN